MLLHYEIKLFKNFLSCKKQILWVVFFLILNIITSILKYITAYHKTHRTIPSQKIVFKRIQFMKYIYFRN